MKKTKITGKSVFAVLFSLIILAFCFTVFERFVRMSVLHHPIEGTIQTETDYSESAASGTDWSKIYPFKNKDSEAEKAPVQQENEEEKSLKDIYTAQIKKIEDSIDYYTSKLLFLRMNFVELNAKFSKLIGNKLVTGSDDIISLADGNLTYYPQEADITQESENLVDFSEFVKENGADFLYVQVPSKVDPDNNLLPGGIEDYDNMAADFLLNVLDENKVDYLDLRKSMKQQKLSYTESFYRTDHHWKTGMGLWAANEISQKLAAYGVEYRKDLLSSENYDETVYEKYMLGSLGKQVTLAYTEPEDISIYTPKFKTDFKVNYYDRGIKEGSFSDSLLNMSVFDKIDYYNISTYSSYLGGVSPITSIENRLADNDKRILFVCDSFSHCVIPYTATQVRYVDKLDLRYFSGSVETFIEKTNPDVVIVMYYPGSVVDKTSPNFVFG